MEQELISLVCVCGIAFVCPLLAALIPNKLIPETVFLLLAGMLCGPFGLNIIIPGDAINLLSDLGLAFLFLLAGYELNPQQMAGKKGKHGLATWLFTFVLALVALLLWPGFQQEQLTHLAIAICLTTTAYGTIVPILHDRGLVGTRIGNSVVAYGVWGELCPVIVIALLLSSRSMWLTGVILVAFTGIAVLSAFIPKRLRALGTHISKFVEENAETNAQMILRAVILLLVGLVCVSALFGLDIVLGAFAAGFVLHAILPQGDAATDKKLQGISYGFFIPLFFVMSGTAINPVAVASNPLMLSLFVVALLLVRAIPVYAALSFFKESRDMEPRAKASISMYCTTALPLIVAVTSVATSSGAMSQNMASVLVSAGAITVLVMPLLASVALHTIDAEMGRAVKEVCCHPSQVVTILKDHRRLERTKHAHEPHVLTKQR